MTGELQEWFDGPASLPFAAGPVRKRPGASRNTVRSVRNLGNKGLARLWKPLGWSFPNAFQECFKPAPNGLPNASYAFLAQMEATALSE
jgi:hypothetical protein